MGFSWANGEGGGVDWVTVVIKLDRLTQKGEKRKQKQRKSDLGREMEGTKGLLSRCGDPGCPSIG